MLKLPKGLKKKKKKSKKDQELFTAEELEQYKREHQAHPEVENEEQQQHQPQQQQQQATGSENDDEWRQFAALTTGIDSILKKTQGDLDRIKSTSFFQRVEPKNTKKQEEEELERKAAEEEEKRRAEEEAAAKLEAEKDPAKELLNAVVELSESEDESEVDDSAFDTTFIDKVEAGELPLAYVVEDEEEVDLGPDPFDTGYAEKVIKGPEVSKRGKKLVNIGAAVEVLTGKVETAATSSAAKQRRQRRGIQNLLLESFEVEQESAVVGESGESQETVPKTILDEPPELAEEVPIDLSVSLHLALQPPKEKSENTEDDLDLVLDSIDIVKSLKVKPAAVEEQKESAPETDWSEFELERGEKKFYF
jgi:hypothetical protein